MGIYPRKMYIVKGRNSGKVITDNFKGRNDLEINTADCSQDKCDVWDVVEKESLDKGFLIWLRLPPTIEDYAHGLCTLHLVPSPTYRQKWMLTIKSLCISSLDG